LTKANAIVVASGKGGVGKTLISTNLALNLQKKEKKVGLLDSDFSASNVPFFLNLKGKEMDLSRESFHPLDFEGVKIFSISLLLGDRAVAMEGAQYSRLLEDAVNSEWGDIEYMVVDAPPGFGDVFRRTIEVFPNFLGCILVSQPAHHVDMRRAINLCKDLEIEILGLIENMSGFLTPDGKNYPIFGESTVDKLGEEFKVPVLGKIPLSMEIRERIEKKDPQLKGNYAEPIEKAVEKILEAKPKKPGFLEKLREMMKGYVDKLIIEMILAINKEINIKQSMERFGYPGGSIIRLNIMKDDMTSIISQCDFMVYGDKLTAVDGEYNPDCQIDITPKAIKAAILKNRTLSNGQIYTFEDALRLGELRLWGTGSMARGAYFMKNVLQELAENQKAMTTLKPILERL